MDRRIITYGVVLALISVCLKVLEYKLVIVDRSLELYGVLLAIIFTVAGMVAGKKLTAHKEVIVEKIVTVPVQSTTAPATDKQTAGQPELSKREYEILSLMAEGYSNQEIADKIYVSIHTVKTHGSNLFVKLDVQRRTQAVKKARELHLIP